MSECPECGGAVMFSTDYGQTLYCAQMHEWSPDDDGDCDDCDHSEYVHADDKRAVEAAVLGDDRPDDAHSVCMVCGDVCEGFDEEGSVMVTVKRRCPVDRCNAEESGRVEQDDGSYIYVCRRGHESDVPADFWEQEVK